VNVQASPALVEKYADLLADVELVAERANQWRNDPKVHTATVMVEAAEIALVRISDAWRKSRGGRQNNAFFDPLSKRMRRVIAYYRRHTGNVSKPVEEPEAGNWVYKITDYEALPFHRLKAYFRASHVDDAIRTGIQLGLRELPGVLIWKEETDE
jgi:hypothetical protein